MKFNDFDMNQVMGPSDAERAKEYIGKEGFVTDDLEDFRFIKFSPVVKLVECVREKDPKFPYRVDNMPWTFKYFVPLTAFRTPLYVPCIGRSDFAYIFDRTSVYDAVGDKLLLKTKDERVQFNTLIIHIEEEKSKPITITLGNGQKYTGEELYDKFLIFRNGSWRPFGIPREVKERHSNKCE